MSLVFGQSKVFDKFCPICGLAIYEGNKGCPKLHKFRSAKIKRYSGKSNSVNKFNDYK